MKISKWRVVQRGLVLALFVCLAITSVAAQNSGSGAASQEKTRGVPDLVAANTGDDQPQKDKAPGSNSRGSGSSGAAPVAPGAEDKPIGFAGPKTGVKGMDPRSPDWAKEEMKKLEESGDFTPVEDRWRIGFPDWDRVPGADADLPFEKGRPLNPYRQNVLKGDYPIIGRDKFIALKFISETFLSAQRIPLPSLVSAQRPDSREFFGRSGLFAFSQTFKAAIDFYQGANSFKPIDFRLHAMLAFNVNYAYTKERGVLRIDPREGNTRRDSHVMLQEAYGEYRLGDTPRIFPFLRGRGSRGGHSPFYDTTSFRAGIQTFNSDFRGFIFNDTNLGARLFGNFAGNRYQFNMAFFHQLEKDTNSGLNSFNFRNQQVYIANLYRQDTFKKGYTVSFSYHHNRDNSKIFNDRNGFPVRPSVFGFAVPHSVKTHYIGLTTDGHFGERMPWILGKIGGGLNLSTAFYQILGEDSFNGFAGRKVDVNAQLAAAELSVDRDWLRLRTTFFYASGDGRPTDGTARGFDSILDDNNFAGGKFSFFNNTGIPFLNTTTFLSTPASLIPALRSSKIHGQANHVNPGLFLAGGGLDADLTQKIRIISNVNLIRFMRTEPLELALFQPNIEKYLGTDYHVGMRYRPYLSENFVIFTGFSAFQPGQGFKSIYTSNCKPTGQLLCGTETGNKILFNVFATIKFTY